MPKRKSVVSLSSDLNTRHSSFNVRSNLIETRKLKLVYDNLNTHSITSLYAAFPAPVAYRLARRFEIYYTPRNGSWLNVAETELSVLSRQCLERRIATPEALKAELEAWQQNRNQVGSKVIWKLSTQDARVKLKHLYPVFEAPEAIQVNAHLYLVKPVLILFSGDSKMDCRAQLRY